METKTKEGHEGNKKKGNLKLKQTNANLVLSYVIRKTT